MTATANVRTTRPPNRINFVASEELNDDIEEVRPVGQGKRQSERSDPPRSSKAQAAPAQLRKLDFDARKKKEERQPQSGENTDSGVRLHYPKSRGPQHNARQQLERHRGDRHPRHESGGKWS